MARETGTPASNTHHPITQPESTQTPTPYANSLLELQPNEINFPQLPSPTPRPQGKEIPKSTFVWRLKSAAKEKTPNKGKEKHKAIIPESAPMTR